MTTMIRELVQVAGMLLGGCSALLLRVPDPVTSETPLIACQSNLPILDAAVATIALVVGGVLIVKGATCQHMRDDDCLDAKLGGLLGIPVVITGVGFGGSAISGFGSTARCRRKLGR